MSFSGRLLQIMAVLSRVFVGDMSYLTPMQHFDQYKQLITRYCEYAGNAGLQCAIPLYEHYFYRVESTQSR